MPHASANGIVIVIGLLVCAAAGGALHGGVCVRAADQKCLLQHACFMPVGIWVVPESREFLMRPKTEDTGSSQQ